MEFLTQLFTNRIFLAVLAGGLGAQIIKIIVFMTKYKQKFHWKDLIVTGSMPSSHSAIVCALAVSVGILKGVGEMFVIALILAAIVIRDAMGVRRTAGEEGKLINELIKKTKLKVHPLHYALGHKPNEVFAGAIIGIFAGFIVSIL